MNVDQRFARYQELQAYVEWTDDDARLVREAADRLGPCLASLVDDFYAETARHEATRKVLQGGPEQADRLRRTLLGWLRELLSGRYDSDYVERRWAVGLRHVELGLDQVFTNVAMSRIRDGLIRALHEAPGEDLETLRPTVRALNKLVDLDLAIIEDAYQSEYVRVRERVERLATIGQVAGGVAHELRNPLNVVKTSVYYLLNARTATPEKRAEHLARIDRHVELADEVITALSSFAKLPAPDSRPVDLGDCLRGALEVNPVGAAVEVKVELPDDLPRVMADSKQLHIVFGNLIRNANDAMPGGGVLSFAGRADAGFVEITVSDTGVGISTLDLVRIMEPLYTTKARGLGLGLAITRSILDKNQGELRVASQPGRGSTFTVRLRAAADGLVRDGHGADSP